MGLLTEFQLNRELTALVRLEARLLDEARYEEWLELFAPEGYYWCPTSAAATNPALEASYLFDDAMLRQVRVARLRSAHAHSQRPPGRCHHLLQEPEVVESHPESARWVVRTSFLYHELRAGLTVSLPGVAWHTVVDTAEGLRILLKRVDLLHAGEPLPAVEFYI
jgi:3-phenylpropionate/cinnamic acid dioxygenase small subunit